MLLTIGPPRNLRPVANTDAAETNPSVRPDGRLVAFQSNSTGNAEVYVGAIDGSWRQPVSPAGGNAPKWSRTGNELYFRVQGTGGLDTLYSARIQGTADISVGEFKVVFAGVNLTSGYAPLPGDSLFLMRPPAADAHRPFIVVLNFVQELDRLFHKK
jgi:dipeptidyl aminopeptidase/acylaminoacyl peptidase